MEKIKLSAEQSHKLIVASDEAFYASKYAADLPKGQTYTTTLVLCTAR